MFIFIILIIIYKVSLYFMKVRIIKRVAQNAIGDTIKKKNLSTGKI